MITISGVRRDYTDEVAIGPVDLVIPELQRRGLFRTAYEGRTLRENLGLPFPENRWSAVRRSALAAE